MTAPDRARSPARSPATERAVAFGTHLMDPTQGGLVWTLELAGGARVVVAWAPWALPAGSWTASYGSREISLSLIGPPCDTAQAAADAMYRTLTEAAISIRERPRRSVLAAGLGVILAGLAFLLLPGCGPERSQQQQALDRHLASSSIAATRHAADTVEAMARDGWTRMAAEGQQWHVCARPAGWYLVHEDDDDRLVALFIPRDGGPPVLAAAPERSK